MKIAIYHNLNRGGALVQLIKLISSVKKDNEIHIFSPNKELLGIHKTNHHFYETSQPTSLFTHIFHALVELNLVNKNISEDIEKENFDAIYVFPCKVVQSPDIIRFLKHKNLIYFFAERKREFYEQTSYDYFSLKRTLTRIIRFPIQVKDFINCINAPRIVVNSEFSKKILKKTYGKSSIVIYPGLKQITPKLVHVKNTSRAIIVGQLSYIKGFDLAIRLLSNSGYKKVTVIGRRTNDFDQIKRISSELGVNIILIETENDTLKFMEYKKHGVFIACHRNEPFGITTLEACYNNNIVVGLNEGGTPEIIHHGLNGYLFNKNDLSIVSKLLTKIRKQNSIKIIRINTINWKLMADKIISLTQ